MKALRSFENNATVSDVLASYLSTTPSRVCHSMIEDHFCTTEFWAYENGMSVEDFIDWVDASLNNRANFKIIKEDGAVVCINIVHCELDLDGGVIIKMDWVVADHC
jgi:hypothetical protein